MSSSKANLISHFFNIRAPRIMLNFLECFIRSQLNTRAICMLAIALVVCLVQFITLRGSVLKPAPDGQILCLSPEQLQAFICDPTKPEPKAVFITRPERQEFAEKHPSTRHAQLYYAATEATTDVAFPIVYGTFMGMLFWWLFGHAGRSALLIPFAIVIADLTENATFIWLALTFDCEGPIPVSAVWPSAVKWSLALLATLIAAYGFTRKLGAAPPARSS